MKMIKELLDEAGTLGACRLTEGVDTLDKLIALYLSPQGREFCARRRYPTRLQWLRISQHWKNNELRARNIFIDCRDANILERNPGNIVLVGASTKAQVLLTGADEKQTVIALHGATAVITASDYAVFEVIADDTTQISITKDDTTVQL